MPSYDQAYFTQRYRLNLLHRWFGYKPGIMSHLRRWQPDGRLLDVGCGTGLFLQQASRRYRVYGVELSPYAAAAACGDHRLAGRIIRADAAQRLPFRASSFQVITALDIVEHLTAHRDLLGECHRLLVPGGVLAISTPNPTSIGRLLKRDQWCGYRDDSHCAIRAPGYWSRLAGERFGTIVVRYDGLWDVPYPGCEGRWHGRWLRWVVAVGQALVLALPSVALSASGLGSPRRAGENTWLYAVKNVN